MCVKVKLASVLRAAEAEATSSDARPPSSAGDDGRSLQNHFIHSKKREENCREEEGKRERERGLSFRERRLQS